MRFSESDVEFESTGRTEYAHAGILGINSDLKVTYGYDGSFWMNNPKKIEIIEMCDHMIALWQALKDKTNKE